MRSLSGLIARHSTAYISLGLFSPSAAGALYHYTSTPLSSKLLPIYLVQENKAVVCQQLSLQPTKEVGPRWNGTTHYVHTSQDRGGVYYKWELR
jgi:hypothetical protein